jgi:hypothetical protein
MAPKGAKQSHSKPSKKTEPSTKKRRMQPDPDSAHDSDDSEVMDSQTQSTPNDDASNQNSDELKTLVLKLARKIDQSLSATNDIKDELKEIKTLVSTHSSRLSTVEDRVGHVESSVSKLHQENEDLRKELCKMNLIIDGIPDPAGEDDDALYRRVKIFISDLVQEDISFDTAYRLGQQKPNHRRPIKVKFLSMMQRNHVYNNRTKTSPPFYINEDLPYSVRRDNGLLRDRKRQEIRKGAIPDQIKIDYKSRSISIAGVVYNVNDGVFQEQRINPPKLRNESIPSSSRQHGNFL